MLRYEASVLNGGIDSFFVRMTRQIIGLIYETLMMLTTTVCYADVRRIYSFVYNIETVFIHHYALAIH